MLAMLIVMTFLVGAYSGAALLFFIILKLDEKEQKKLAKDKHPTNQVNDGFMDIVNAIAD